LTAEESIADAPALLKEYFASGEKEELARSLTDTKTSSTHNNFVKKAFIAGMLFIVFVFVYFMFFVTCFSVF
jgi:hypothetical protein